MNKLSESFFFISQGIELNAAIIKKEIKFIKPKPAYGMDVFPKVEGWISAA
ncbi:hypothetical protein [Neobacillus mesonae]|uniref:hypothetical protein n=1 Tax=Neobacillus mesonae TaxID=1193713 RepID=UPI0025731128|nr:hypothetical protein [Neobacillus mesonae]MED4203842.1 hypothetical protein [Neobacillus mesonae]